VVSQGGVGGVGETLRRLSWADAMVDADQLITHADFEKLQKLPRDEWPGR
jgi:hypothetical protein